MAENLRALTNTANRVADANEMNKARKFVNDKIDDLIETANKGKSEDFIVIPFGYDIAKVIKAFEEKGFTVFYRGFANLRISW